MSYILANPEIVLGLVLEHLAITGSALVIATLIALPVGVFLTRRPRLVSPVLGVLGIIYTIPSLALMIFFVPIFGLSATSVVVALVIYSQVILVRNVVAGLQGIDRAILEAARGMGMSAWQRWWRVEFPLALPTMLAGLRIAAVVSVAIATIGAKFSAGGLGRLLFDGIQQGRYDKIWAGAIAVAALAWGLNALLVAAEQWLSARPERVKITQARPAYTASQEGLS